jgi:hypothetical protein
MGGGKNNVPLVPIVSNLVHTPFHPGVVGSGRGLDMFQRRLRAAHRLFYGPIGPCLDGEKYLRKFALWGGFGPLFMYLEMSEQVAGTGGLGAYGRSVS